MVVWCGRAYPISHINKGELSDFAYVQRCVGHTSTTFLLFMCRELHEVISGLRRAQEIEIKQMACKTLELQDVCSGPGTALGSYY